MSPISKEACNGIELRRIYWMLFRHIDFKRFKPNATLNSSGLIECQTWEVIVITTIMCSFPSFVWKLLPRKHSFKTYYFNKHETQNHKLKSADQTEAKAILYAIKIISTFLFNLRFNYNWCFETLSSCLSFNISTLEQVVDCLWSLTWNQLWESSLLPLAIPWTLFFLSWS